LVRNHEVGGEHGKRDLRRSGGGKPQRKKGKIGGNSKPGMWGNIHEKKNGEPENRTGEKEKHQRQDIWAKGEGGGGRNSDLGRQKSTGEHYKDHRVTIASQEAHKGEDLSLSTEQGDTFHPKQFGTGGRRGGGKTKETRLARWGDQKWGVISGVNRRKEKGMEIGLWSIGSKWQTIDYTTKFGQDECRLRLGCNVSLGGRLPSGRWDPASQAKVKNKNRGRG